MFKCLDKFREFFFGDEIKSRIAVGNIQGGSNMTGTDVARFTHKSVPVIFEPPCVFLFYKTYLGLESWVK